MHISPWRALLALVIVSSSATAQSTDAALVLTTPAAQVRLQNQPGVLWEYRTEGPRGQPLRLRPPELEVGGRVVPGLATRFRPRGAVTLRNGAVEHTFVGPLRADTTLEFVVTFRMARDNPVVRFRYALESPRASHRLTKTRGRDNFTYLAVAAADLPTVTEVRLSEFDERVHATTLTEVSVPHRYFESESAVMGPIVVLGDGAQRTFLLAYEHGSQLPERFLEYQLRPDRSVVLRSVKGNYLDQQPVDAEHPYQTLWFEVAGVNGGETKLAERYRDFVLRYLSENLESRRPYVFYNTWGRQERTQWAGNKYLTSMNLKTTLAEIDVAHRMGIEVYVVDAGWFEKTGDWRVNTTFFPDTLQQVRARLEGYGMKLGLWFNPTVAALSSRMLARNAAYAMSRNGKKAAPFAVWETEESQPLSLVSPYWEEFADELIRLNKELGVSYFKWDAVDQHGSDAPGHFHGTEASSRQERADSYAFQLPLYLSKIVDKVSRAAPRTIFDFDVTEPGRAVGLQFLSSGKFFLMNNGPYYHNYDLAPPWKSVNPNGNANIFVEPGPARGWFTRAGLRYDKWIPSVLFLTHYQPDEPRSSQTLNLASLVLGQNGIWGEILKTSPEGVTYIGEVLAKYKQVREDITLAPPVVQGEPGGSPEIHEKINPANGRGVVVLFANASGRYRYVTERAADRASWQTGGPLQIRYDARGRAVIDAEFTGPGARIVFFGAR
jgi:alpha-galactosidase